METPLIDLVRESFPKKNRKPFLKVYELQSKLFRQSEVRPAYLTSQRHARQFQYHVSFENPKRFVHLNNE